MTALTATLIKRFAPNATVEIVNGLVAGAAEIAAAGIDSPRRLQHFMAQLFHESAGLRTTREFWGPTPAQLRYEGRVDLGNTQKGDGSRYRGRGLIQTTGRTNYREATVAIRKLHPTAPDFEANPPALEQFPWALASALVFWTKRGLNGFADRDDVVGLTRRINGGDNGLDERKAALARARVIFAAPPPAPAPAPKPALVVAAPARPSLLSRLKAAFTRA